MQKNRLKPKGRMNKIQSQVNQFDLNVTKEELLQKPVINEKGLKSRLHGKLLQDIQLSNQMKNLEEEEKT